MNKTDELSSDFLFARPSFTEGFSRMVDITGSLNTYNTSRVADARAISQDWKAIGRDVRAAIKQLATAPRHK